MKIATFNINNVNRRLPNLLEWLETAKPDVVCLQELKCTDATVPGRRDPPCRIPFCLARAEDLERGGHSLARFRAGRNAHIPTRRSKDDQARYIEAAISGVLVGCIYLPNGNPQPGPKFDYKLAWFRRLQAHARKLLREGVPVVLAGDYNVAPTEIDIYPTTSWDDDALVQPESRAAYAKLAGQGWTDAMRELHPGERIYTFWHYLRNRWQRNAGLRLDHLLLSPAIADRLKDAGVDRDVQRRASASDHAPVWIILDRERKPAQGARTALGAARSLLMRLGDVG